MVVVQGHVPVRWKIPLNITSCSRRIFCRGSDAKLASYEVAGVGGQNGFVPRGTMESGGGFPASFQDAKFCGRGFQPQCGWLISGAPSEQSARPADLKTESNSIASKLQIKEPASRYENNFSIPANCKHAFCANEFKPNKKRGVARCCNT
jgi:hypothetical protein